MEINIDGKKYYSIKETWKGKCTGCIAVGDKDLCDALQDDCVKDNLIFKLKNKSDD